MSGRNNVNEISIIVNESTWELVTEQGHDTEYEDDLTDDCVKPSQVSKFEMLNEWEYLCVWVSHKTQICFG